MIEGKKIRLLKISSNSWQLEFHIHFLSEFVIQTSPQCTCIFSQMWVPELHTLSVVSQGTEFYHNLWAGMVGPQVSQPWYMWFLCGEDQLRPEDNNNPKHLWHSAYSNGWLLRYMGELLAFFLHESNMHLHLETLEVVFSTSSSMINNILYQCCNVHTAA